MIPKRIRTRNGDREYACGKCGKKVGYYVITGSGESDCGYHKDNFCQSCGEKVEWIKSREERFTIYIMKRYRCGHFEFTRAGRLLRPEEYGNTVSVNQCVTMSELCPMCEAKYRMDRAEEEYKSSKEIYLKYKAVQDSGENFFETVSDEMRGEMFRRMQEEDKGE